MSGYEKKEESWIEYTYTELVEARKRACEKLGIDHTHWLSNTELCGRLGLVADVFRAQRIIKWARETPKD